MSVENPLMPTLTAREQAIFNNGERLIPGVSHDYMEVRRHFGSYYFFKSVIARDIEQGHVSGPIRILDLGCGVGFGGAILADLPRAEIVGIDISPLAIDYAQEHYDRPNITWEVADIMEYVASMQPFTYVISRGVLEHVPNGLEAARKANWHQRLMVDVPYKENQGNPHHVLNQIDERSFAAMGDVELFYEDLAGHIFAPDHKPECPNMIMCCARRAGLPAVRSYFATFVPDWQQIGGFAEPEKPDSIPAWLLKSRRKAVALKGTGSDSAQATSSMETVKSAASPMVVEIENAAPSTNSVQKSPFGRLARWLGRPQKSAPSKPAEPSPPAKSSRALIFLHLPKTAGATLLHIVAGHYRGQKVFTTDAMRLYESIEEFKQLPIEQRRELNLVQGHMAFGLHEYLPQGADYITMLRDPVDRALSHYFFARSNPKHYLHERVISGQMSLMDYVTDPEMMLDNEQVRLVSGVAVFHKDKIWPPFKQCGRAQLELAKDNLRRHFSVVGVTESFDGYIELLRRALGWQIGPYQDRNVNSARPQRDEIPADVLAAVREYNALDIELYDFARGLYEQRCRECGVTP